MTPDRLAERVDRLIGEALTDAAGDPYRAARVLDSKLACDASARADIDHFYERGESLPR